MGILEAFEELKITASEAWENIKLVFQTAAKSKEKISVNDYIRSTWISQLDTRRHSQVISRKPLFAIQKII